MYLVYLDWIYPLVFGSLICREFRHALLLCVDVILKLRVNNKTLFCSCLGWILIDRCGKHFSLILNFLRDGTVPLPQNEVELQEILIEAKYYLIESLAELCEKALEKKKEEHDPICRVPLITSSKEERQLVTGKKVHKRFFFSSLNPGMLILVIILIPVFWIYETECVVSHESLLLLSPQGCWLVYISFKSLSY